MLTFKDFIKEDIILEAKDEAIKHLEHPEDHIFNGNEGVDTVYQQLNGLHIHLSGKKRESFGGVGSGVSAISIKKDGSPALVMGYDKKRGKHFVATKSVHNKEPKINYTSADVDRNHGDKPGLAAKLKIALSHVHKFIPKNGSIYQGDFMYDKNDLEEKPSGYAFKPNTVQYRVKANSPEGRKIFKAKMGIAVHTKYEGSLGNLKPTPHVDDLIEHPDVHLINTSITPDPAHYTVSHRSQFLNHMENARQTYSRMKPEDLEILNQHKEHLRMYMNSTVRRNIAPDAEDYIDQLRIRSKKEASQFVTPQKRESVIRRYTDIMNHVMQNKKSFENAFKLHTHLEKAKNVLGDVLNAHHSHYEHYINDKKTGPEGYVVHHNTGPFKVVKRRGAGSFSMANFLNTEKPSVKNKIKEEYLLEAIKSPVVFAFGRMNPPTTGHGVLVNKVHTLAKQYNAHHEIVLSHSHDKEKNPLSQDKKLEHARRFFPGTNIIGSSKEMPSLFDHAKRLEKEGHDHLIVVGGSDRVAKYQHELNKYNGKDYHFKKITVVSAGERDPDAEGAAGMSGSKMREHARNNDFESFKKGIPSHVTDDHAKQLFNHVRQGMGIKEKD